MNRCATRAFLPSLAVAAALLSAVPPTGAQARSGDLFDAPLYQNHKGDLIRLQDSLRPRYHCSWSDGKCPNPPAPVRPVTEPGTFWRLISICEHLEGVSCFLDPYVVDDNN